MIYCIFYIIYGIYVFNVDHMLHCGVVAGSDGGDCWASEPFQHILYNGLQAVASETSKQPAIDLEKLISSACPYYKDVCGLRWRP